ncbi:GumC family protein [Ferrimonas pelagia]|uniref:Chain-length determining protein n=1 Tax=Ferrimonas pelagia TaxID=1177826 RepID=A0ABP9FP06_9GAMM
MLTDRLLSLLYYALLAIWQRRLWLALPVVMVAAASLALNVTAPDRFLASTTLLVQEPELNNPTLDGWSVAVRVKDRLEGLRTLLRSRHMLDKVVSGSGFWPEADDVERQRLYRQLAAGLQIDLKGSSLIRLQLSWPDQDQIAPLLTIISEQLVSGLMAPGSAAVERSERFLEQQMQAQIEELSGAEAELAAYKQTYADLLPSLFGATNQALQDVEKRLRQNVIAKESSTRQLSSLNTALAGSDPVIGELESRIVMAEAELVLLRARYTDAHSKVKALLAQVKRLQKEKGRLLARAQRLDSQDLDTLWQLASAIEQDNDSDTPPLLLSQLQSLQQAKTALSALEGQQAMLQQQRSELMAKLSQSAEVERELLRLSRSVEVKRSLLDQLQLRYEKAQITSDLGDFEAGDKTKIIDQPKRPHGPTNAPASLALLGGMIGGLGLGLMLVLMLEWLDPRLIRSDRIAQLAQCPVLARERDW